MLLSRLFQSFDPSEVEIGLHRQIVQHRLRFLEEQSGRGLLYLSFHLHLLKAFLFVWKSRVLTANFLGLKFLTFVVIRLGIVVNDLHLSCLHLALMGSCKMQNSV